MGLEIKKVLDPLANVHVTTYAPPGEGKTFFCATASEFFPVERLTAKVIDPTWPVVTLKDMLWILFDNTGLAGLNERRIIVPNIDMTGLKGKFLSDALREVPSIVAAEQKQNPALKYVCGDTITSLDIGLLSYYLEKFDKWDLYNAVLKDHRVFFDGVRGLGLRALWCFHEKFRVPVSDDAKGAAQTKGAAAAAGVELGKSGLDISGRSLNFYRGQSSLILPVRRIRTGTGNDFQYIVTPRSAEKDSKTRYMCLADREPANLRAIFQKIEANVAVPAAV